MSPDWLTDVGRNLIGIVATSLVATAPARVALMSVAQTLLDMMRLGIAQDLREHRDHQRDKHRLERANLAADELVKRATAMKTVAEAVQIANTTNPGLDAAAGPGDVRRAAAELREALEVLGVFGGELGVDSTNLEMVSAIPTWDTRVASIEVSPVQITLSTGVVTGSLETVEASEAPAPPTPEPQPE